MKKRWIALTVVVALLLLVGLILAAEPEYAYTPPQGRLENPRQLRERAYDRWGEAISEQEAERLLQTPEGRERLSAREGAVRVDDALLDLGRRAFYQETFGNEIFFTKILGVLDGPMSIGQMVKAILALGGRGTTDLQVEIPETVTIGGRTFEKGTLVSTGLDVPRGAFVPIGVKTKLSGGRLTIGITCAACHSTLNPETMEIVEGAPNLDINTGLLLAFATNSAAFFAHTEVPDLETLVRDPARTVETTDGRKKPLPDPRALEDIVDRVLLSWPPGNFDSTFDLHANPAQIPDSFTLGDHPYGWTGFAMAGPFNGLSVLNNNVHGINADALLNMDVSRPLLNLDPEVYMGILLQNAADPRYRFDPTRHRRPTEFFASVDPTPGSPGVNQVVKLPTYGRTTLISPIGLVSVSPGHRVWEENNAMSAFQNVLIPATPSLRVDRPTFDWGRAVFERAGCATCHAGPAMTNNRVIPVPEIGTEPVRAPSFKDTQAIYVEPPLTYSFDTRVPVPPDARVLTVPTEQLDMAQVRLSMAYDGLPGGYKVKGLIGLYWSPPYLHDGGVSVGSNPDTEVGMAGTLMRGIRPDPYQSMRAMVDRGLRARVVAANQASEELRRVNVRGIGHPFWVDGQAGFSATDQDALIRYLLAPGDPLHGQRPSP